MKTNSHELLTHVLFAWRTLRALAYIDPGTGSYCFQMLIAGLTGLLFFFSSIKRRVLSLFGKAESSRPPATTAPVKNSPARKTRDEGVNR
jgi:hypothetical protein